MENKQTREILLMRLILYHNCMTLVPQTTYDLYGPVGRHCPAGGKLKSGEINVLWWLRDMGVWQGVAMDSLKYL
jgi:hypothetical protein